MYDKPPSLAHLRVFGDKGYALFPGLIKTTDEFAARGVRAIFLGMGTEHRSYMVYIPEWRCVKETRSLKLDETSLILDNYKALDHTELARTYRDVFFLETDDAGTPPGFPVPVSVSVPPLRRSQRIAEKALHMTRFLHDLRAPKSYRQILQLPSEIQRQWKEAYQREIDSITSAGGLRVVPASEALDQQIIPLCEVFTIKTDNVTKTTKFKVRLCCRGGLVRDKGDTYASMVGLDPLRLLLSLSMTFNLQWMQADVSTAFHARDDKLRHYRLPQGHPQRQGKALV